MNKIKKILISNHSHTDIGFTDYHPFSDDQNWKLFSEINIRSTILNKLASQYIKINTT